MRQNMAKTPRFCRFWQNWVFWGPFVKVWTVRDCVEWLAGYRPPAPVEDGPVEVNPSLEYYLYERVAM